MPASTTNNNILLLTKKNKFTVAMTTARTQTHILKFFHTKKVFLLNQSERERKKTHRLNIFRLFCLVILLLKT